MCGASQSRTIFSKPDKFGFEKDPFCVVQCEACGLRYVSPRPRPERLMDFYPEHYSFKEDCKAKGALPRFLKRLESYYRQQGLNYEVKQILRVTGKQGGSVLEIGCGTGDRLALLKKRGFACLGLEPATASREFGERHFGIPYIGERVEDWKGPEKPFDLILLFNLLEHLPYPAEVLQRIISWLRPEGVLVIQVPNAASLQAILFGPRWAAVDPPRDLFYFTPQTLNNLLRHAGLQIMRIEHGHHWAHPPTLVPSLFPSLDPAILWGEEAQGGAVVKKIGWGLATLAAIPWGIFERLLRGSAIMTIYAQRERNYDNKSADRRATS